ncbi:hypothetical protein HPP92_015187 [Vanilla planifolia]|uniref:Polygalacturonase n=1 Tax=Vanilla planifolia TaxID=51239 RepID=A0A835QHE1_VANPL|nr:hypothetical protein HPP92_015187 [Vanilla planifolia]
MKMEHRAGNRSEVPWRHGYKAGILPSFPCKLSASSLLLLSLFIAMGKLVRRGEHFLVQPICLLLLLSFFSTTECRPPAIGRGNVNLPAVGQSKYQSTSCRTHSASLSDFGAVSDGKTSNTKAFQDAVAHLSQFSGDGGGLLYIPPGRWLTGPFNLTSCFTLFLHRDAVILASQGCPGGRYSSLIMGSNLTDVVITGDNGTIDGQGDFWWAKFHHKQLKYTRGYLVELMYSDQILISNLFFLNSPSWNIHPVYSSNIVVKGITISAPVHSPNTDGINPDSCSNVRIEDSYIVSGDDCVAIKSGWDEYGIAVGMPSQHIVIRRLTCVSPTSATIALGSEMSGGIRDVRAEDITAINTESGVRIKTAIGRGAFVKDVFVRRMTLDTMKWVFWMTGNYNSHPDGTGRLQGIAQAPFKGICISNVTVGMRKARKQAWFCENVNGVSSAVSPEPCDALKDESVAEISCPFPTDRLPIEDVELTECPFPMA